MMASNVLYAGLIASLVLLWQAQLIVTEEDNRINLGVERLDGITAYFVVDKDTPLEKLMVAYCKKAGLSKDDTAFLYGGSAVYDDDTPNSLSMQYGDIMQAYQVPE